MLARQHRNTNNFDVDTTALSCLFDLRASGIFIFGRYSEFALKHRDETQSRDYDNAAGNFVCHC